MTPEQEAHLQTIKDLFLEEVDAKYRRGVEEHGGNVWEQENLLEEASQEAVDLYVYITSLKLKLRQIAKELAKG